MKNSYKKLYTVIIIIVCSLILPSLSNATEGTDFWFGLPFVDRSADETLRGSETNSPNELFLSSRYSTTVDIYIAGSKYKTVNLVPNTSLVVAIPDGFENQTSEKIEKKGFHLLSSKPFEATVYISWKWTGEAYKLLPVNMLGVEHYTLNMFEDYNKDHAGNFRYHPSQILVVATSDSTKVTYTPTYETQKGIKKDASKTIVLNTGECFNILGKLDPAVNQNWESDLTGSNIKSDKPIAVFTGHTKVSFPKHAATSLGLKSDFYRNTLIEPSLPLNLLDTLYVSAPIMYTGRTAGYGTLEYDRGDIIRFVATADSTNIFISKADGSGDTLLCSNLAKGHDYKIMESQAAARYRSNKPILVGQYGKSWWQVAVSASTENSDNKDDEELQNPPKCGQGMLMTLLPNSTWTNYAEFNSPKGGMYNYINIIFKSADLDSINFDNRLLTFDFENRIKLIPGTEFSYISAPVVAGYHCLASLSNNVKFAVYVYGNLDGGKDGFSYGYFASATNIIKNCNESPSITDKMNCNIVEGTFSIHDLDPNFDCAKVVSVDLINQKTNVQWSLDKFNYGDSIVKFRIIFDADYDDSVTIRFLTYCGNIYTKTYDYKVKLNNTMTNVQFKPDQGTDTLKKIYSYINNENKEITIKKLFFKRNNIFSVENINSYKNIKLQPNQVLAFTIKCVPDKDNLYFYEDSLMAELDCNNSLVCFTTYVPGELKTNLSNLDFGSLPRKTSFSKKLSIKANGDIPLIITNMVRSNNLQCFTMPQFEYPITIQPNDSIEFNVTFTTTDAYDIDYVDTLKIVSNAIADKLYSVFSGSCILSPTNLIPAPIINSIVYQDSTIKLNWTVPTKGSNNSLIKMIKSYKILINDTIIYSFDGTDHLPGGTYTELLSLTKDKFITCKIYVDGFLGDTLTTSQTSEKALVYSGYPLHEFKENFETNFNYNKIYFYGYWKVYSRSSFSKNNSISDGNLSKTDESITNFDFILAPILINESNKILHFSSSIVSDPTYILKGTVYLCKFGKDINNKENYTLIDTIYSFNNWTFENKDLSNYIGDSIFVAFKLVTNVPTLPKTSSYGWFIDDLEFRSDILNVESNYSDNYILSITPNPVKESSRIKINLCNEMNLQIDLFDLSGNQLSSIYNGYCGEGEINFPVSLKNNAAGKYFVRVVTDKTTKYYSIIKE